MSVKYRVYEVVCKDPSVVARYIGYTSMTKGIFLANQLGVVRDPVSGKTSSVSPSASTLQSYVVSHGGWSNWDFRVFKGLYESRSEAGLVKDLIISRRPGVYSINIYKVGGKRAKPTVSDTDSDYESVCTED